ncbi:MAG: FMN-dependent L-lactate dehydrogenase LldD [Pseudomonadota bacterium]
MNVASGEDFRRVARRRLPRFLFDYLDGGANAETTLGRNIRDLQDVALDQRVLRDVSHIDLGTTLFGVRQSLPIVLGPVGISGMCARRGEAQAARAACRAGIPFTLSTVSICSVEEVALSSAGPLWFQLYVIRDRGFMRDMLARAKEVKATALVFTVDMPVPGVRHRDAHSGMSGRFGVARRILQAAGKPAWAFDVGLCGRPHTLGNLAKVLEGRNGLNDYMGWLAANFDPAISWADLDWLRATWDGPLIIKGILNPADARSALRLGANGVVVSNHGGRQLDGALSSARALPAIADAVGNDLTVLADSGVRSGLDVLRLLALGARGVLLGRAWAFALAARGEGGVSQLLEIFARELRTGMALTGVRAIGDIDKSILAPST